MAKQKSVIIIIVILLVLLLAAILYIVFDKYTLYKQQREFSAFQQGAQAGYEQAVIQVAQQASTCNQVPLRLGNQTMNIIWVDCLRTLAQQAQQQVQDQQQ